MPTSLTEKQLREVLALDGLLAKAPSILRSLYQDALDEYERLQAQQAGGGTEKAS